MCIQVCTFVSQNTKTSRPCTHIHSKSCLGFVQSVYVFNAGCKCAAYTSAVCGLYLSKHATSPDSRTLIAVLFVIGLHTPLFVSICFTTFVCHYTTRHFLAQSAPDGLSRAAACAASLRRQIHRHRTSEPAILTRSVCLNWVMSRLALLPRRRRRRTSVRQRLLP
jgi:hypothetical protein